MILYMHLGATNTQDKFRANMIIVCLTSVTTLTRPTNVTTIITL